MRRRSWPLGIFDFDGTLWKSTDLCYGSYVYACKKFNIRPVAFDKWRTMPISHPSLKNTPKKMYMCQKRYFNAHWREVDFYAGANELIQLCEAKKMFRVIVSGQDQKIIVDALSRSEFGLSFNNIHGEVRNKEETLVQVLDEWGYKAEEAFYLDDTYQGLTAAKNLRITAIGITHGLHPESAIRKARPDFIVHSLYEVMGIVKNGCS